MLALAAALLVPATGAAAPADDCEYCLELPEGDGSGEDPSANASGSDDNVEQPTEPSDDTTTTTTPETPTTPEVTDDSGDDSNDDKSGAAAGNRGDGNGNGGGGNGGEGAGISDDPVSATDPVGSVDASPASSDDSGGGVSGLLIAIAVIAAGCVGLAVWRIRRGGDSGGDTAPTSEIDSGAQST